MATTPSLKNIIISAGKSADVPIIIDFNYYRGDLLKRSEGLFGAGDSVTFYAGVDGGSLIYLWDFGDGTTSDSKYPVKIWALPGTYTISLYLENEFGNAFLEKIGYITITRSYPTLRATIIDWGQPHDPLPIYPSLRNIFILWGNTLEPPTAGIYTQKTKYVVNKEIQFVSYSTGNPDTYEWDFGDGNISTEKNPIHIYSLEGIYTISLYVENSYGNNTETKVDYLTIIVVSDNPLFMFSGV